jgi:hypothetical protein
MYSPLRRFDPQKAHPAAVFGEKTNPFPTHCRRKICLRFSWPRQFGAHTAVTAAMRANPSARAIGQCSA